MSNAPYQTFDLDRTAEQIAEALGVASSQVHATVDLLDSGNTIPFIARYRKEATRGLDEIALRGIEDSLSRARELAQRKATILKTIDEQGQLTGELRRQIETCSDKQLLEDLYLPFKPKRRTRATIARERGLQPLAEILLKQQPLERPRRELLQAFVDAEKGVEDEQAALQGACDIVAELWSEDAETRSWLSAEARRNGQVSSQVKRGKKESGSKFEMYFDHQEPVARVPSHRLLAMKRGEAEGVLRIGLTLDDEPLQARLKRQLVQNPHFEFHVELQATVEDCYTRLLLPAMESAMLQELKERADDEAIAVFAKNLRELLLAPPAGPHVTIGIDPGFRTGCKVAVVDGTGKFLASSTIYPTPPRNDVEHATKTLLELIGKYDAKLIAIGNGTASRETDAFVTDLIRSRSLEVTKVTVSESGASIYSASELAAHEYPHLDVTVRGRH